MSIIEFNIRNTKDTIKLAKKEKIVHIRGIYIMAI
jgi:hypothetical protein